MCAAQTYEFCADTKRILSLFCNSIYKNHDTSIRELISNSSDALDKIRFESLSDPEKLSTGDDLCIDIKFDSTENILTIADTGIGMTECELIKNLGTIAQTGTRAFLEANAQGCDINMIGQFGVGFYSVFLIADRVKVISKHNDDDYHIWESCLDGTFNVSKCEPYEGLTRGTVIIIYLKEGKEEYAKEKKLKEIIKKHSLYISHPIRLEVQKEREIEVTDDEEVNEEEETKIEELDEGELEKVDDKQKKKKKMKENYLEKEVLNKVKPIWTRNPSDITDTEYGEFYKSISNDWEDHLAVKHYSMEGQLDFTILLYVPKRAPFDLFETKKKKSGIKLYVRRIFVMDDCEDLIPEYMNFLKGIVDSEDLPLNLSRETIQSNSVMKVIKKNIVKKVVEMLLEMKEDKELYKKFYEQYHKSIKLGIHEDSTNQESLTKLVMFPSSKSGDELTDLDSYVKRMKEKQKDIYYICGEDKASVLINSVTEQLIGRGYELIYAIDPIDEYALQKMKTYDGHNLVDTSKDGLKIPDDDEEDTKKLEELKTEFKPLCDKIKEVLGADVEEVYVSNRLKDSPCCIVTNQYGWSANMQRIMNSQALRDTSTMSYMNAKIKLEINPSHAIIAAMLREVKENPNSVPLLKSSTILFTMASIQCGLPIKNKSNLLSSLTTIIACAFDVNVEDSQTFSAETAASVQDVEEPSQLEEVD